MKAPGVAEQPAPGFIAHINADPEALLEIVVPLTDFCHAREQKWKPECDRTFIEPLCSGTKAETAVLGNSQLKVYRKVLA